jgi:DnaJ-class molecular chaperone
MNFYELLELSKDATHEEIKKSYKKLALKYHPDRGGDAEKFKLINRAYETLSDPEKKSRYDQFGTDEPMHQGPDFSQMFETMFNRRPKGLSDHEHIIHLSLDDVYSGVTKTIKITTKRPCFSCLKNCPQCKGQGVIQEMNHMFGMIAQMFSRPCGLCQGACMLPTGCPQCQHQRHTVHMMNLNIKIEKGIQDGTAQIIEGFGEHARTPKEKSGNLVIIFRIKPHPVFERHGNNLRYRQTITFEESINGYGFTIPHFGGHFTFHTHDIAAVIDPRRDYEIKGKGLTNDSSLFLNFDIQYPRDFSARYNVRLEQMCGTSGMTPAPSNHDES